MGECQFCHKSKMNTTALSLILLFLFVQCATPLSAGDIIELYKIGKEDIPVLLEMFNSETEIETKPFFVKQPSRAPELLNLPRSYEKAMSGLSNGKKMKMIYIPENEEQQRINTQRKYISLPEKAKIELIPLQETEGTPVDVGIDLGTTFCTIAYWDSDGPHPLISNGDTRIPSSVEVTGVDEFSVGSNAFNFANIRFSKRMIGLSDQKEISRIADHGGFTYNEDERAFEFTTSNQIKFYKSPEDITTMILQYLYEEIMVFFEEMNFKMNSLVISIPANFDLNQRIATINAAHIAGFKNFHILKEPVAVAFATKWRLLKKIERVNYNNINTFDQDFLVVDIGGGTTDLAIVQFNNNGVVSVLGTHGVYKGGIDLTFNLYDHVNELYSSSLSTFSKFFSKQQTPSSMLATCEKIKIELSKKTKVTDMIGDFTVNINRTTFESINDPIWDEISQAIKQILDEYSKENNKHITKVILTGGGSYIPKVKEIVKKFDLLPVIDAILDNPQDSVAIGAAYYANLNSKLEVSIEDVVANRIEIKYQNRTTGEFYFKELVPKNQILPFNKQFVTKTTRICQPTIDAEIYETNVKGKRVFIGKIISNFTYPDNCLTSKQIYGTQTNILKIDSNGVLTYEVETNSGEKSQGNFILNSVSPNVLSPSAVEEIAQIQRLRELISSVLGFSSNKMIEKYVHMYQKIDKNDLASQLKLIEKMCKVDGLDIVKKVNLNQIVI